LKEKWRAIFGSPWLIGIRSARGIKPFGPSAHELPWLKHEVPIRCAKEKMDVAFEFITKIEYTLLLFSCP